MSTPLRTRLQRGLLISSLAVLAPSLAAAGVIGVPGGWDEAVQGDLSGDGNSATFVGLTAGSNLLLGTTGRSPVTSEVDRDYFTVSVPAGFELTSMEVLAGTMSIGSGAFIGLVAGSSFPIPPDTQSAAGMLGWTLYDEGNVGSDLLLFMSAPSLGASGFTPPLPAGEYSFWIQELSTGVAPYRFDLTLSPVPEPATALSLLAGLALLAAARRRR
jgi:hypothetical protein